MLNQIEVYKKGRIFIGEMTIFGSYTPDILSESTVLIFSKVINRFYDSMIDEMMEYDEIVLSMNVVISFTTVQGWRAIEKTIFDCDLDLNNIITDDVLFDKCLPAFAKQFEEYELESIELLRINII